jgi:hypothetical protein
MYNADNTDYTGNIFCFVNTSLTAGVPTDKTKIRGIIQKNATGRGNGQTLMTPYTVPNGKEFYLRSYYANVNGASSVSSYKIRMYARNLNATWRLRHTASLSDSGTSSYQHIFEEPVKFDEKTDIILTAQCSGTGITGISLSAGFQGVVSVPRVKIGYILQEDGTHILQETGYKILR